MVVVGRLSLHIIIVRLSDFDRGRVIATIARARRFDSLAATFFEREELPFKISQIPALLLCCNLIRYKLTVET